MSLVSLKKNSRTFVSAVLRIAATIPSLTNTRLAVKIRAKEPWKGMEIDQWKSIDI